MGTKCVPSNANIFMGNFELKHIYPYIKAGIWKGERWNRDKFIGSNLVIFCYKEFEKFALCKSNNQSKVIFIVYSEPIESGHVEINFS